MNMKAAFSLLAAASLAFSSVAFAGAKTYEVTGPVLEVNDSMIVVQKGKDRWEINRDANTKVTGDVKVGDKVHVTYTMSATEVEVKAGKGGKKDKKEAAKPAPKRAPWAEQPILSIKEFKGKRVGELPPHQLEIIENQWIPIIREAWDRASQQQKDEYNAFEAAIAFHKSERPW